MPTYKLTIEYEGTRYSGWQTQGNTPKTIQGRLIEAASAVFGEVDIGGAGRTDAGVHAAAQIAHLRTRRALPPHEIPHALNDQLPYDIHVLRAEKAVDGFHARHDAIGRVYLYQISTRRTAFGKPFVWWIKDRLDVGEMSRAIALIEGRHDFAAFTDKRGAAESSLVVVDRVEIATADDLILIRIAASHFLWKMVRKLVAALVEIGRGTISVSDFQALLTGAERGAFQPTAAPSGLFLEAVSYPGETFGRALQPIVPVSSPPPPPKQGRRR